MQKSKLAFLATVFRVLTAECYPGVYDYSYEDCLEDIGIITESEKTKVIYDFIYN